MKLKCFIVLLLLGIGLFHSSCGYRVRSSVGNLPNGVQSLGIPTFQNLTNQYKIEQRITEAVLREFQLRTRASIRSKDSGVDAVLEGEIRSVRTTPVTFGDRSFGSAFLVTVEVGAKLIRLKDSAILWQNRNFTFIERYAINSEIKEFFSEENPALQRLAQSFASSLVSTILESQSFDSTKH